MPKTPKPFVPLPTTPSIHTMNLSLERNLLSTERPGGPTIVKALGLADAGYSMPVKRKASSPPEDDETIYGSDARAASSPGTKSEESTEPRRSTQPCLRLVLKRKPDSPAARAAADGQRAASLIVRLKIGREKLAGLRDRRSSPSSSQQKKKRRTGGHIAAARQPPLPSGDAVADEPVPNAPLSRPEARPPPPDRSNAAHVYSTRSRKPGKASTSSFSFLSISPRVPPPRRPIPAPKRGADLHIDGFSRSSNVNESVYHDAYRASAPRDRESFRVDGDKIRLGLFVEIPLASRDEKKEEGPPAAWRRLFPGEGELAAGWQERMKEEGGEWVKRREGDVFVPVRFSIYTDQRWKGRR